MCIRDRCYPHHEVLASTSGSTGSSAATVICSEGLLQSDASYITVIACLLYTSSERKVYIPGFVAQCLIDIKKEQDEVKEALGSEYTLSLIHIS